MAPTFPKSNRKKPVSEKRRSVLTVWDKLAVLALLFIFVDVSFAVYIIWSNLS